MGYCANGSGSIVFDRRLSADEENRIGGILDAACFEFDFYSPRSTTDQFPQCVDIWHDDKYHGDVVSTALRDIADLVPIRSGCIEYAGEDFSHWRFLYKPEDESWHEQDGQIVYEDT